MVEWSTATVESCLDRFPFGKVSKVLTRDYKPSGSYPIIDQGQSLIAGWTDDDSGLISTNLPIVVFGDHTRAFKYVDFPFVRGADGTQLLKPKAGLDPLFFYYACRAVDLPSRGYNRHFKALKEKEIPMPPLGEQRKIARILQRIDDALSLQDEQFRAITNLKRTTMRSLFTHGLRGEMQKETEIGPVPESWVPTPIVSIGLVKGGKRMPKGVSLTDENTGKPYIRVTDFQDHSIAVDQVLFVPKGYEDVIARYLISSDDIYISIAGTIGLVGQVPNTLDGANLTENAAKICVTKTDIVARYVMYALASEMCQVQIAQAIGKNAQPKLALARVEQIKLPLPTPRDEQHEIVTVLDAIDRKIDLHRKKRAVLDGLFKALLHKLMTGEIRVADLNLSSLPDIVPRKTKSIREVLV